jgi:hypothetical protein
MRDEVFSLVALLYGMPEGVAARAVRWLLGHLGSPQIPNKHRHLLADGHGDDEFHLVAPLPFLRKEPFGLPELL